MSSVKPTLPAVVPTPTNSFPKHSSGPDSAPRLARTAYEPKKQPQPVAATPVPAERRHTTSATATTALSAQALSSTDVSYVKSLMGALPAQKMEEILLKTGVPIPANLGPNIDTGA